MSEKIKIKPLERRELITDEAYAPPKYTFYAIDAAIQYSGATAKSKIGDISGFFDQFEEENPEGNFDDWKQFYLNENAGNSRIDEATEQAYHMFLKLREAIEQIDNDDIQEFIQDLVLNKTYSQRNCKEAVIEKLVTDPEVDCSYPPKDSDPEADVIYKGNPVVLEHSDSQTDSQDGYLNFRYSDQEDGSIVIDLSEINQSLSDY